MLSIFSLAYNEENKLKNWVDKHKDLADDFVLIDTGSNDNTIEVAKSLGIKVFSFEWIHHFSAAKNFAISQCKTDWIFNLPVDSTIRNEDFDIIKKALNNQEMMAYTLGLKPSIKIPNSFIFYYGVRHFLIFRKDPRIIYHGRVHETIDTSLRDHKLKTDNLDIMRIYTPFKETNKVKEDYYRRLNEAGDKPIDKELLDKLRRDVWG